VICNKIVLKNWDSFGPPQTVILVGGWFQSSYFHVTNGWWYPFLWDSGFGTPLSLVFHEMVFEVYHLEEYNNFIGTHGYTAFFQSKRGHEKLGVGQLHYLFTFFLPASGH